MTPIPRDEGVNARYADGWYFCWLIESHDGPQTQWLGDFAPICEHKGFYICKICGEDLTPDIPYGDGPGRGL